MSAFLFNAVRAGFYLDSVALMRLSREIAAMPGIAEAAMMMGSPSNKGILRDAGLLAEEGEAAAPNDLVIAVRGETREQATAALAAATAGLARPRAVAASSSAVQPRTLRGAQRSLPDATLALISVPADFAVSEARGALRGGLDVLIFTDNISIADEVALKREAQTLGRIVMGPDCGTAIINGTPIAFANRVPGGAIGIIGASGTGIQEVSSLIALGGGGISHAIGVGGRDLSRDVGALSTLAAIDLLDRDPATHHIVLISKPPHADVARAVLARVAESAKPFTICFLGAKGLSLPKNATLAPTLRAAAEAALGRAIQSSAPAALAPRAGAIVGLFSGGTLAAEAQLILLEGGRRIASNAPVPGAENLTADGGDFDRVLDLGADEFTRGRPHPMIDPAVRANMMRATLADANVAVILIDLVIGTGAHGDPASAIAAAMRGVSANRPFVVGSVTGTEQDPQGRSRQIATLEHAGVLVAPSNAHAAELALALAKN